MVRDGRGGNTAFTEKQNEKNYTMFTETNNK